MAPFGCDLSVIDPEREGRFCVNEGRFAVSEIRAVLMFVRLLFLASCFSDSCEPLEDSAPLEENIRVSREESGGFL